MDVVEWAILETKSGMPPVGLTLHLMDRGVDTGPILIRHPEPIQPGDNPVNLRERLESHMVKIVLEGLRGLRDDTIISEEQKAEDGRQYFVMHPRFQEVAARQLTVLAGT